MGELFQKWTETFKVPNWNFDAFGVFVASCTDILPVCQMFLPQDKGKNDKALRASAQETSVIKSKVQDEASYLSFGEHKSMFYIIIIGGCE